MERLKSAFNDEREEMERKVAMLEEEIEDLNNNKEDALPYKMKIDSLNRKIENLERTKDEVSSVQMHLIRRPHVFKPN